MEDERTIVFRPALLEDLEGITQLCSELGYPTVKEEVDRCLQMILAETNQIVYVAAAPGKVLGWIHVYIYPLLQQSGFAEIGGGC